MTHKIFCSLGILIFWGFWVSPSQCYAETKGGRTMNIEVTSTAFQDGAMIPKVYTCDGQNISPPLSWSGVPTQTKSIALIMDDPDAPRGTWVHWVLFNIPPDTKDLPEKTPLGPSLANGARQGMNSWPKLGYGGPCPPSGIHRYYFKIYALDLVLPQQTGMTKAQLIKAMEGHILAQGQLMGKYTRK
ncbi:MAG: YbhB/YbcL family Raf kinase inhibitor-like protein [Desulfomonilaceae bacterium]